MKILYLSCHSVLEYDEVKLLTELGFDVFSHGVYANPSKPGDPKRPAISAPEHPDLYSISVAYGKENLHQDMVDWADVILCMHRVDWLERNWDKFKGKRVIWRSIGQSTLDVEAMLAPLRARGLEVVRYSPRERTIPGFVGEDAIIRFYKDPDEFKGWRGDTKEVLTVGQSMKDRDSDCNWSVFDEATRDYPRKLYGEPSKADDPLWRGKVSYDQLKAALRAARVYFYTGTYPASYTLNFIEAWMTGTPIVALGPVCGNSPHAVGQQTYEVPDLFDATAGGLYADSVDDLRKHIRLLMDDVYFANQLSARGRAGAIKFFGKLEIGKQWKQYLNA